MSVSSSEDLIISAFAFMASACLNCPRSLWYDSCSKAACLDLAAATAARDCLILFAELHSGIFKPIVTPRNFSAVRISLI